MTENEVTETAQGPLHRFMTGFFFFVSLAGGLAFAYKLWEFFQDLTDDDGLQFAGSHLMTYCLVAGGFILLLLYTFMRGNLSEIETPKYEMLHAEERHDREEFGIG